MKLNNKKRIIGMSIETNNLRGQSEIGLLWQKFFSSHISKKVKERKTHKIYAVYYNYESDFRGDYSCLVGFESDEETDLDTVEIEEGDYKKVMAIGELPRAVGEKWLEIWQESDEDRIYKTDFEVYDFEKFNGGPESEVEIYLGTK